MAQGQGYLEMEKKWIGEDVTHMPSTGTAPWTDTDTDAKMKRTLT